MTVTRSHIELATAGATALLGVVGIIGARELGIRWQQSGPESGYFPFYISLILILASLWNAISAWRRRRAEAGQPFLEGAALRRIATFFVELVLFVVLSLFMGLYVGCAVYIAWSAWRHGNYPLWLSVVIGAGFSIAQYLVFEVAFLVPLHKGPIEPLLGIY